MTLLTARVERRALRNVAAVLVENAAMLEHLRASGHPCVVKAPPGVDTGFFSPALPGWRRGGHLLSVCRLNDPRKGLERMIHAYAIMVRRDAAVPPLVLAGIGLLPQGLSDLINNLQISSRVSIRPNLDKGQLVELYRGASVFLQTSYEEGFGMSVLEAMACGLPVVCTDTAGAREIVLNGVTGWLVPQNGESAVYGLAAERVLEILRGNGAIMGAGARERCEKAFSNEVALRNFTDVYDDLLSDPRGDQRSSRPGGNAPTSLR
jgi:glycosyltransferase involved in cell wall biosynthesis